jgi:hypothetical protein
VQELESFAAEHEIFNFTGPRPRNSFRTMQILYKRKAAFASSLSELRKFNGKEFDVQLIDEKRVKNRKCRNSPEKADVIQKLAENWEKHNLLQSRTRWLNR